jgi:hypothetical protein
MKNFLCFSLMPFVIFGFMGCAATPDTQPIYDAHVMKFNANYANIERTLQRRDGYNINAREFGLAHKGKKPSIVMLITLTTWQVNGLTLKQSWKS